MKEGKFEDYVYINKLYLSLLGIWPLQDDASIFRVYIQKLHSMIIVGLMWFVLILPSMLDLYIVWGDVNAIVQNLCNNVHNIFISIKLCHVIANQSKLKEVVNHMKNNWDNSFCNSASEEQKIILLQHAGLARSITKFFLLLVYFFEVIMYLLPFIYGIDSDPARKRRYPICAWYYYDQSSDVAFFWCYLSQVLTGFCFCVGFAIGMDSFCCVVIYHSCAQLNIIQSELLKVGNESVTPQNVIKQLIRKHNDQIRIVKKVNQLFSTLCLYQLLTSCIVICSTGFQIIAILSSVSIDFNAFVMYFTFFIANLIQILLYCWPSDELMEQSLEIGNAAYQSIWTELSQDSTKAIMLVMLRAQKPLIITAGGMYEMTLKNFTAIVKASMSGLSLLRAVNVNH